MEDLKFKKGDMVKVIGSHSILPNAQGKFGVVDDILPLPNGRIQIGVEFNLINGCYYFYQDELENMSPLSLNVDKLV